MSQDRKDQGIDYVEFACTDMDRTKQFYTAAFGWAFTDWGAEYMSFEDGRLGGGFRKADEVVPGGPLVILYAADLAATEARVKAHGGAIVQETFSFPGGRRFHFADPSGNVLAVWTEEA